MPPIIPKSLKPPARARTIAQIREAKIKKPSTPKQIQQAYQPSEELKKVELELKDIDRNISVERNRIKDLQNRLKDSNLSGEAANRIQDNIAIAQAEIRGYDKARNLLKQGYTVKSAQEVQAYESAKTRETIRLQDEAQKLGYKSITEYRKAVQEERAKIAREEFEASKPKSIPEEEIIVSTTTPQYYGTVTATPKQSVWGKITDFGTRVREQTIFEREGIYEKSPFIPPEEKARLRLERYETIPILSTLVKFEKGKRQEQLKEVQKALIKLEERGEVVGFDTKGKPFYEGKDLTNKEKNLLVQEGYLPDTRGQNIPYGLQPYRREDPRFQITKFLIEKPTEYFTGKKPPVWQMQLLDFYIKFSLAGPSIETGAAKKTEQRVLSDKEKLEIYMKQVRRVENRVAYDKVYARTKYTEVIKKFGKNSKEAKFVEKLYRNTMGTNEANALMKDALAQEGLGVVDGRIPTGILDVTKPTPDKLTVEIDVSEIFTGIPKMEFLPEVSTIPQGIQLFDVKSKQELDSKMKQIPVARIELDTKEKAKEIPKTASSLLTGQITEQVLKQPQLLKQPELLKEKEVTKMATPTDLIIPKPTPQKPIPKKPPRIPIIPFIFPGEKKPVKATRTGYHTFVKSKGKYKQVTDKPYSRSGAMDIGSRIVDNTVSADFKIVPIKQTKTVKGKQKAVLKQFKEKELSEGDNYFRTAANKFRQFMVRRGNKIQTQDRWIEKKNKRLDTPGEQRGLSVANFMARQTKTRLGLPIRRTKKKSKKKRSSVFRL